MDVDFELYKVFVSIADHSNITKASEALHISQPAVTQLLKKLENQLKVQLFIRTKRGVILTEEGKTLYKYIKEGVNIIRSGEKKLLELKNLEAGSIKIGVGVTLARQFLLPYLDAFRKLYPNITIDIKTFATKELMPMLKSGLIDMIVLNLPYIVSDDIKIIKCKKVQDCFIANKEYKDKIKGFIKLEDINNFSLILQSNISNTRKFLDTWSLNNKVILKPAMEVDSYSLVVEFTKIGMGVGYATREYIEDELRNGELFEIKTIPSIPSRSIGIAVMRTAETALSAKKLIEMVQSDNK